MAINYPGSGVDGTAQFAQPVGTSLLSTATDHALTHTNLSLAVIALENKVGTTAGSAAANLLLVGAAAGASNWQQTWNNGTLGTATINNSTIGTSTVTGGTINGQVANGGTVANGVYGTATYQAGTLAGQIQNNGTIANGVYGTATYKGGTMNNATFGTPSLQIPYRAGAYLGTNQVITNTTFTLVGIDTILFDSNSNFGTSTNLYTAPVTGYYMICGLSTYIDGAAASGKRIISSLYVNGTSVAESIAYGANTGGFGVPVATLYKLNATDTVGLYAWQETGGNGTLNGSKRYTYLDVHLLSV